MTKVRKLGQEGAEAGTALAAHAQTEGAWQTWTPVAFASGRAVSFGSFAPSGVNANAYGAPQRHVRLAAVDALRSLGEWGEAGIKWPNDIVIADQKLAGILVEAGIWRKGRICRLWYWRKTLRHNRKFVEQFSRNLTASSVHLRRLFSPIMWNKYPTLEQLATTIRDAIVRRAKQWEQSMAGRTVAGPLATILDEYFDAMPAVGQVMDAVLPDGRSMATGVFAGMDVWGRAILVTQDGEEVTISAEQASLRRTASA